MNINLNTNKLKEIKLGDSNYPEKLLHIYNPPKVIYVLGNEKLLCQTSIAIIGCRDSSRYGNKVSYYFASELSKRGINIVSGMARGIDTYAHKGSVDILQNKDEKECKGLGKTIAVLGCGLDTIYPEGNKELYKQIILGGGAIITEYPLGTKPLKYHFPARNRIISGLSEGVLVIEAKQKSGTLITVDYALEQGKDVYAIPRRYIQ